MANPLRVRLISWTHDPIKTAAMLWNNSRSDEPVYFDDIEDDEARDTFKSLFYSKIPVLEAISFVFILDNVPISLREQMVRHRVGTKFGVDLTAGMIPDLPSSTWWSQTMRVKDMGCFYDDGDYHIPKSIQGTHAVDIYLGTLKEIQSAYNVLRGIGVAPEDARELLPLAVSHRISWSLNLVALQHLFQKRTCWITQMGIWQPLLEGIMRELTDHIDHIFQELADPPCFNQGVYSHCPFKIENYPRIEGLDPYPPCPLFVNKECQGNLGLTKPDLDREQVYSDLWGRNVRTGEKI